MDRNVARWYGELKSSTLKLIFQVWVCLKYTYSFKNSKFSDIYTYAFSHMVLSIFANIVHNVWISLNWYLPFHQGQGLATRVTPCSFHRRRNNLVLLFCKLGYITTRNNDGRRISRNIDPLNLLVHNVINFKRCIMNNEQKTENNCTYYNHVLFIFIILWLHFKNVNSSLSLASFNNISESISRTVKNFMLSKYYILWLKLEQIHIM